MSDFNTIHSRIEEAKSIVITAHKSADGDSVGSSLGLYQYLKAIGKEVVVCHPDVAPNFLKFLPGAEEILSYDVHPDEVEKKMKDADMLFALDYNGLNRMNHEMSELFAKSEAFKVMIDHHLHPEDFVDITISQSDVCSTSQLIYELLDANDASKNVLNATICSPLYLGIVTDTGSFRFPSVTSRTHQIVGEMLELGVNHSAIHEAAFDSNTIDRLRLRGYATSEKLELIHNGKVALMSLTHEELERFNYQKGDTEGLVNVALSVSGVNAAIFLSEKDGSIKISFRAKGLYEVNQLASEHFDGGGHKYASGGISTSTMDETITKLKTLIPKYFD